MSASESIFILNTKEKKAFRRLIRHKKRGYRYAIKCEINFDNVATYANSILAYAEHFVYFIIRKKYRMIIKQKLHIFDISSFYVNDHDSIEIHFSYHIILISSSGIDKFAHILYRIISYTTKPFENRLIFNTYNSNCYPIFNPNTSITQQIQMCYDGYCAYLNHPYYHDLVLFIHQLITTENVILDLSLLPCHILTSSKLDKNFSLAPFFSSLINFKYFAGITCQNGYMPDILRLISPLIRTTKTIRFLTLINLGITYGAKELARAIKRNPNLDLVSIDLSSNQITDLKYFTKSLRYLKKPLYSLNLSNCKLSKTATENLCISLMLNPNLQHLKHFEITGAEMTSKAMVVFSNYFHRASVSLYRIHLGKVSDRLINFLNEINSIQCDNPVLESFSLCGIDLSSIGIEQLNIFIRGTKTLKELDLSSTKLSTHDISKIIHSIGQNGEITSFALHLNDLNLNKENLEDVLLAFDERNIRKWMTLSFENNGLNCLDFQRLLQVLSRMSNLITLNIGLNFSEKTNMIESYLPNVLSLTKLERLSIRGSEKCFLTHKKIDPFVKTLSLLSNRALRLNIKDNKLGSKGYRDMKNLIVAKKLIELQIDGNNPDSLSDIFNLCEVARESLDMNLMNFPSRDAMRLISKLPRNYYKGALYDLESKRRLMMQKLQFKLSRHGIHSTWTLNGIPEIEEIVDHQTKIFHSFLERCNTSHHSLCCQTLGIPFPFHDSNLVFDDFIDKRIKITDPEVTNIFKIYNAFYDFVEEKVPENKGVLYSYLSFKNSEYCENTFNILSDIEYSSRSRKLNVKLFSFDEEEQKGSLDYSNSKTKSDENQNNADNEHRDYHHHHRHNERAHKFNTNPRPILSNESKLFWDSNDDSIDHFS